MIPEKIPRIFLSSALDFVELLHDKGGKRSRFCTLLKLQHISECSMFADQIMLSIDEMCGAGPSVTATLATLRDAIVAVDPNKARSEVNTYLARGVGFEIEEMLLMEAKKTSVSVSDFKKRLRRNGLLKKSPPTSKLN